MKKKEIKIFIGLLEVAGYFSSLNEGFHELGIKSFFFQYWHRKYYNNGTLFMRCCQFVSSTRMTNKIISILFFPIDLFLRMIIFCWAIFYFNVFIYASTSTFFWYKELWLLKKMGKKIIFVFLGTESRPDYLSGNIINDLYLKKDEIKNIEECVKNTLIKKNNISKIEKYADICINHPPCAFFQTKPYIKWLYIGFPFSEKEINKIIKYKKKKPNRNVNILHAPSNPKTKGTKIISEIIGKLKNEGKKIDYIELIDLSNTEVLELIGKCDFVIDELYSDIPIGRLGVETAFAGKTIVNAGYYGEFINKDYDKEVIPPTIYCEPSKIENEIRLLISDYNLRSKSGKKNYEFVLNNWKAKDVANRYINIIKNNIPKIWFGDPYDLHYIYGYGQSKEQLQKVIDAIIYKKGIDGFGISDKPYLIKKLIFKC